MFRNYPLIVCTVLACLAQVGLATGQDQDVDNDLIIWWKLDETTGTTATDSSGHRTHGLLRNGPKWVTGADGGGLQFDGKDDYAAISGVYYGLANNADVTVCTWIRTTTEDDQVIISFDRNEYWRLEINGAGAEAGRIGWDIMTNAGQVDLAGSRRVDDGQWHHIAALFDRGRISIYVDGQLDVTTRVGSAFGTGNPRFGFVGVGSEADTFDGDKAPESYFKGDLDEVRLYTRALSESEIAQLARHTTNNDDCQNALAVGGVVALPFDTTEATADGPGLVIRGPNIWYRYTASCTGPATVSLCGSQFDTMLAAYIGGNCSPGSSRLIGYNDDACGRQSELSFNVVAGETYLIEIGGYRGATGQGVLTIACDETDVPEFDLGDAPDSTSAAPMTAYTVGGIGYVNAHFPTVFADTDGRAAGPLHLLPLDVAYLGETVTLEAEADTGSDEDPRNNIDPAADKNDRDGGDDGVIFPINMPHCSWAAFDYLVNVVTPENDLWVNVWCDFNRDGDWDDSTATDPMMGCDSRDVSEWAVQNQLLFDLPVGLHKITTPAFLAWHPEKGPDEIWMRITLSEKPWRGGENAGVTGNAGSGPADGFEIGETEDYLFTPESADCVLCRDLNGDGVLDWDDLIELMYLWLDSCTD